MVNNMSYNEKSDIWSMGCMLYEICALHPPFTASNQQDLNKKICIGDYKRIPSRYSEDLNTIISKLLCVEVLICSRFVSQILWTKAKPYYALFWLEIHILIVDLMHFNCLRYKYIFWLHKFWKMQSFSMQCNLH